MINQRHKTGIAKCWVGCAVQFVKGRDASGFDVVSQERGLKLGGVARCRPCGNDLIKFRLIGLAARRVYKLRCAQTRVTDDGQQP